MTSSKTPPRSKRGNHRRTTSAAYVPKQPDLISTAAQADARISEAVERLASSDYGKTTSKDTEEREQALERLRALSNVPAESIAAALAAAAIEPKRRGASRKA
jgi:hypothetical protein